MRAPPWPWWRSGRRWVWSSKRWRKKTTRRRSPSHCPLKTPEWQWINMLWNALLYQGFSHHSLLTEFLTAVNATPSQNLIQTSSIFAFWRINIKNHVHAVLFLFWLLFSDEKVVPLEIPRTNVIVPCVDHCTYIQYPHFSLQELF